MTELAKLYQYAEQNNIPVDCFALRKREALSFMEPGGACYIAIDPKKLQGARDEKLKLGHELGHCSTGSFYNRYAARDLRRKHENHADKWAIERLIPVDKLDEAIANGYTEIWMLAEFFDVSIDFMRKTVCWYVHGNLDVEDYMSF